MSVTKRVACVLAALVALGCGAAPAARRPAVTTVTTAASPAAAGTVTTAASPAQPVTSAQPPPSPSRIAVPNGVGMNYQRAQDLWRGAGLHVLPATDAKGTHRLPIIDSNWVVLSQDPAAGTEVDAGSFITATVKKYTDT